MATTLTDKPKIGDVREVHGIEFTATEELTAWGQPERVIGMRWNPGPIGYVVNEAFSKSDYRFEACNVHSQTFAKAATRSLKRRAADYRKALDRVASYEAIPEEQRALVAKLG